MQTIIIAGGTGMIGSVLQNELVNKGYKVTILTRNPEKQPKKNNIQYAQWNLEKESIDQDAIKSADFIVNLTGANVMGHKWTESYKKEIIESRTKSTLLLAKSLTSIPNNVKAIINSSAIGYYGEDKVQGYSFVENDSPDKGFLGETCRIWEESLPDQINETRVCRLRTGIVLGKEGGFIEQLKLPVKFGIAPIISKGKQVISWIHVKDLCRMIIFAMENNIKGNFNAVAPTPATNKEITIAYAQKIRNKFFVPLHVPSFVLKLMMGQRAIEILKSTRVSCNKIINAGFTFLYPSLESGLDEITDEQHSSPTTKYYKERKK